MARYIDGDRAIELIAILIEADKLGELTAVSDARLNECKNHKYGLLSAYRSIEQVPTADVEEVRHARVIEKKCTGFARQFYCSWCGADICESDVDCPYCKECGAKMGERK